MMQTPLQIVFRHMESSPAVEEAVRRKVEKLGEFHKNITGCRVLIEKAHRHQQQGEHFHIRIEIVVPGQEIVVAREPDLRATHEDFKSALRDSFDSARRQLQDYVRRRRGDVKTHEGGAESAETE